MNVKECSYCREVKDLSEFHRQHKKYDKSHKVPEEKIGTPYGNTYTSRCKICRKDTRTDRPDTRKYNLSTKYGLTLEDYDDMVEAQNNECAICGISGNDCRYEKLVVDHDHDTDEIRGLLCTPCNIGIGLLRDSPEILARAIVYLTR